MANQKEQQKSQHKCARCQAPATKLCSRCQQVYYCSPECQRKDWKFHKKNVCNDAYQANQYTLHKQAFDRIIQKYNLNTDAKSTEISEFLTSSNSGNTDGGGGVSPQMFVEKFGTTQEEAV